MQVEIEITKTEKASIEVVFPLFVEYGDIFDNGGSYDCYARIDESLTRHKITEHSDGEWQYEVGKIDRVTLGKMASPKSYAYDVGGYNYSTISAVQRFLRES